MGRLREATQTVPRPTGGLQCTLCAFIESLPADDRADADDVLVDSALGYGYLSTLLERVHDVQFSPSVIRNHRMKGHRR